MRKYRGPKGECDRCGGLYYLSELRPQKQAAGRDLIDTGWLVCRPCLDEVVVPRIKVPLDDPLPIFPPGHGSKP